MICHHFSLRYKQCVIFPKYFKKKYGRGPKLEGWAFANFGNSSGARRNRTRFSLRSNLVCSTLNKKNDSFLQQKVHCDIAPFFPVFANTCVCLLFAGKSCVQKTKWINAHKVNFCLVLLTTASNSRRPTRTIIFLLDSRGGGWEKPLKPFFWWKSTILQSHVE